MILKHPEMARAAFIHQIDTRLQSALMHGCFPPFILFYFIFKSGHYTEVTNNPNFEKYDIPVICTGDTSEMTLKYASPFALRAVSATHTILVVRSDAKLRLYSVYVTSAMTLNYSCTHMVQSVCNDTTLYILTYCTKSKKILNYSAKSMPNKSCSPKRL